MLRHIVTIACTAFALAACIAQAATPTSLALKSSEVALFEQERGRPDYVVGYASAAPGATEVTLFADAAHTHEIAWGKVAPDGSFGPIEIGDDAHARVWLVASNDRGYSTTVTLDNVIAPGVPKQLHAASTSAAFVYHCDEAGCGNARTLNGASFDGHTIPEWTNSADDSHQLAVHFADPAGAARDGH